VKQMKRGWFLLLALSVGLNAGLLYISLKTPDATENSQFNAPPRPGEQGAPPRGPRRTGESLNPTQLITDHLRRMDQRLMLSEAQRDQLETMMKRTMPTIIKQRQSLDLMRHKLANQYRAAEFDSDSYRSDAAALHDGQVLLDSLVVEAMIAEAAVLTREQRQEYVHMMPWPPKPGGRGDRRSPKPPPGP
jgi:Spy/CpxP family protein refolding chaperone